MSERHRILIVEDERDTADALREIVTAQGWSAAVVDNKLEATAAMRGGDICAVILDLNIKGDAGAMVGHAAHGEALLRDVRQLRPEHLGQSFWLPILVVSAFATDREEAVRLMYEGATKLIDKPFTTGQVADALRFELARAGRTQHEACGRPPQLSSRDDGELTLEFTGETEKQRTIVLVAGHPVALTTSDLRLLLRLAVSHLDGEMVHKVELGHRSEKGFKGISRLRQALSSAPRGRDVIKNDFHGGFGLTDRVVITRCVDDRLRIIGDRTVTELAQQLAAKLAED